jgi:CRP/FNR family transcriptional regulator, anaerobic regulatory protein
MDHDGLPTCALGVPFLRILPAEGLLDLRHAMRHQRYARGERVATAGDPVDHLVVLARGRLKEVQSASSGREQVVRTLGPGEFLGELGLFSAALHDGDLIAQEASDVCLLPRHAVQGILQRYPAVALRLVEALAERLVQAERTIAEQGTRDVGQRLALELLRASAAGTPTPEGTRVQIPVPWAEVAAHLGTTPESLSRRLKSLAGRGIIRQDGPRAVVIRSPEELRALAEA